MPRSKGHSSWRALQYIDEDFIHKYIYMINTRILIFKIWKYFSILSLQGGGRKKGKQENNSEVLTTDFGHSIPVPH